MSYPRVLPPMVSHTLELRPVVVLMCCDASWQSVATLRSLAQTSSRILDTFQKGNGAGYCKNTGLGESVKRTADGCNSGCFRLRNSRARTRLACVLYRLSRGSPRNIPETRRKPSNRLTLTIMVVVRPCDQKMRSTGVENIDSLAFAG
jgi:hypothetical protein